MQLSSQLHYLKGGVHKEKGKKQNKAKPQRVPHQVLCLCVVKSGISWDSKHPSVPEMGRLGVGTDGEHQSVFFCYLATSCWVSGEEQGTDGDTWGNVNL